MSVSTSTRLGDLGLPANEVIIGLDAGTTGVKAAAFAPGSPWRTLVECRYPIAARPLRQDVQDPRRILEATEQALRACIARTRGARVRAVSLSAAAHGLVGLDATGQAITPLLTWADRRAEQEATALARAPVAHELAEATGLSPQPMT